jgi:hypothetical protein
MYILLNYLTDKPSNCLGEYHLPVKPAAFGDLRGISA